MAETKPQSSSATTPKQGHARQHQRYHSQYYPQQPKDYSLPAPIKSNHLNSFPRSVSGVVTPGRRAIVTHGETAVPCRVTLYGADTHVVERGLGTLVPPPQFRMVPVNPPAAASWHLQVTAGDTPQRLRSGSNQTASPKKTNQNDWENEKPKSWDNLLSTRSFGGYGFGYGYIDINSSSRIAPKVKKDARSVSTNRLNEDSDANVSEGKTVEIWTGDERSRTVPRRMRNTAGSADNLISPLDISSCFSCDCIGLDHMPLESCMFNKPKSSESLLTDPNMAPAASETSLADNVDTEIPYRRRSRTSSLADCLGGNKHSQQDQMTHL